MSQSAQAVAPEALTITGPLAMLGTYQVQFSFPSSTTSTRTVSVPIQNPPNGVVTTTIMLQSFDVFYSDNEQYGYGRLQVAQSVGGTQASCTVTLRDNHLNERKWEGTVMGLVTFFGN